MLETGLQPTNLLDGGTTLVGFSSEENALAGFYSWIVSILLLIMLLLVGFYYLWPRLDSWLSDEEDKLELYGKYGIMGLYLITVTYLCLVTLRLSFKNIFLNDDLGEEEP